MFYLDNHQGCHCENTIAPNEAIVKSPSSRRPTHADRRAATQQRIKGLVVVKLRNLFWWRHNASWLNGFTHKCGLLYAPARQADQLATCPKCPFTSAATSRIAHCPGGSDGGSTPHSTSGASESDACSEPCEPPPTCAAPPQSTNS